MADAYLFDVDGKFVGEQRRGDIWLCEIHRRARQIRLLEA